MGSVLRALLVVASLHAVQGGQADTTTPSRRCQCKKIPGNPCCFDEELALGQCHKRCTDLTNGTHPYRRSKNTCCSLEGAACLWPGSALTLFGFGIDREGGPPQAPCFPLEKWSPTSKLPPAADMDRVWGWVKSARIEEVDETLALGPARWVEAWLTALLLVSC